MKRRIRTATYLSLPFIMLLATPLLNGRWSARGDRIPLRYELSDRIVVDLNLYTPDARYPLFLIWDYVRSGGLRYMSDWGRHNEFLEGHYVDKMRYDVAVVQSALDQQGDRIKVGDGRKLWWQTESTSDPIRGRPGDKQLR